MTILKRKNLVQCQFLLYCPDVIYSVKKICTPEYITVIWVCLCEGQSTVRVQMNWKPVSVHSLHNLHYNKKFTTVHYILSYTTVNINLMNSTVVILFHRLNYLLCILPYFRDWILSLNILRCNFNWLRFNTFSF